MNERIMQIYFYLSVISILFRNVDSATTPGQRTWTSWYNTHIVSAREPDDDESIEQIRQRGYDVCLGQYPVDVLCRDVHNHTVTFNSKTRDLVPNYLFLPCTTKGLICRLVDQTSNRTCRDYEVQFECNTVTPSSAIGDNIVIIVVAASMSVLLPIMCITAMHIIRRKRRQSQSQEPIINESTEQSAQTEAVDLPPSYSVLFGEGILGPQAMTLSSTSDITLTVSTADGEIEIPLSSSRRGSRQYGNRLEVIPEIPATSSNTLDSHQIADGRTISQNPSRRRQSSWRRRFPNLHLSIFEIFASSEQDPPSTASESSQTSTFSYLCTPPPTYKDAIFITGGDKDICLQVPTGVCVQEPIRIFEIPDDSDNEDFDSNTNVGFGDSVAEEASNDEIGVRL